MSSPRAIVLWATVAALAVVLILAVLRLGAAAAQAKRLQRRVDGYADLPVVHAAARAEADGRRIEAAVDRVPPLIARAQAAIAIIRRGPVPAELPAAFDRVRAGIAALRAALPR